MMGSVHFQEEKVDYGGRRHEARTDRAIDSVEAAERGRQRRTVSQFLLRRGLDADVGGRPQPPLLVRL